MNWFKKVSYREEIEATEEQAGYDPSWGEHMGRVRYKPDTWNFGSRGLPSGTSAMPLPKKLYHATPDPDRILQEGFKTFINPDDQTFGGHGTYVSLTTLGNAKLYADAIKEISNVAFGKYKWSDALSLATKWGMEEKRAQALISTIERWSEDSFNLGKVHWDDKRKLLGFLAFSNGHGSKFPALVGTSENLVKKFIDKGITPDKVGVVEVTLKQPLKYHTGINMDDDKLKEYYTYNSYENEWRIFDPSIIVASRRIE